MLEGQICKDFLYLMLWYKSRITFRSFDYCWEYLTTLFLRAVYHMRKREISTLKDYCMLIECFPCYSPRRCFFVINV